MCVCILKTILAIKSSQFMFELKNAEGKDHRGKMMVSFTSI